MVTNDAEHPPPRMKGTDDGESPAHLTEQTLNRVQHLVKKSCPEIQKVFLSDGTHAHLALNAFCTRSYSP